MNYQNDQIAVENSALWAAYGDALGFISELVNKDGLRRRINDNRVTKTVTWKRMVGGRFGANVEFPAGTYSDDTQLRLATSRAIRGDGTFDVEAFAKVELPVWLSYALGAGRGSKAAAASLGRPTINWFSNFFDKKYSVYINGGGNGAAMRIQPHVWAAKDRQDRESFLLDVIRNAICTHGHFRGILGAVFHAKMLAKVFDDRIIPSPDDWVIAVKEFSLVAEILKKDDEMKSLWLPTWEERSSVSVKDAITTVIEECLIDIDIVRRFVDDKSEGSYFRLVEAVGALKDAHRGSGTKTAIIAVALSWMYRDSNIEDALIVAANLLSSDTDSIATMVGAMLGALSLDEPSGELQDRNYISQEARRLFSLGQGSRVKSFSYPDIMQWSAPKTQLDALGLSNGHPILAGLGNVRRQGKEFLSRGKDGAKWQWQSLEFGQTVVCKRRSVSNEISPSSRPFVQNNMNDSDPQRQDGKQGPLVKSIVTKTIECRDNKKLNFEHSRTLDELTNEVIKSGFSPVLIGNHILSFIGVADSLEKAVAYAAIVVKAKVARERANRPKK